MGLVSSSSSNNKQADVFMVMDDQISTTGTGITKVGVNPIQIGQFEIGDEKLLTFARFMKNERNCITEHQPCGLLDGCCAGLGCTGFIQGECVKVDPYCVNEHQPCGALDPCCAGLGCTGIIQGECVPLS
ncbi:hypothetical protein QVD17_14782 [Tagetes erecta]|uniref:Uncharacterized protein n=1 Tax=Tagetes erecta TaxID=13708 RepID=A0AAD8KNP0_TARER|nr:hypothetical protein QVD17_14782 [Tagetes erecta]